MSTKTVTIGTDGSLTVVKSDSPAAMGGDHQPLDTGSFVAGLMLGMLIYFIAQSWIRWQHRRAARADDRRDSVHADSDVAHLARRTANLERIVTDPATRVSAEIDALR